VRSPFTHWRLHWKPSKIPFCYPCHFFVMPNAFVPRLSFPFRYLARSTGHRFVRINNHEHTDLQEYLGSYQPNSSGKLVFQEGPLVTAVRHGHVCVRSLTVIAVC
jgi:hypothetical protein